MIHFFNELNGNWSSGRIERRGCFVDLMSEPLVQLGVPVWGVEPVDRPGVVPHTGRDADTLPQSGYAIAPVSMTQDYPSEHSIRYTK